MLCTFELVGGFPHLSILVHDACVNDTVVLVDSLQVF